MEKKNIIFTALLGLLLLFSGVLLVKEVSATGIHITTNLNASLEQAIISGGNFTINVTTSNESNAQQGNGGWAANISIFRLCERETTPTVIISSLNTSNNQSTRSFGINTTQFNDCNMTLIVRASNRTSGATLLHIGGETNVTSTYINNSVLTTAFVTADNTNQETDNASFSLVLTTSEQASNVTANINSQLITLTRTNSSGMRWTGSLVNLPENTYSYTVTVRALSNDLHTYGRSVTIVTTGQGKAYGAFGAPLLAPKSADGTTPGTTTQEQKNNYLMMGGIILAIWFFFGR